MSFFHLDTDYNLAPVTQMSTREDEDEDLHGAPTNPRRCCIVANHRRDNLGSTYTHYHPDTPEHQTTSIIRSALYASKRLLRLGTFAVLH